MSAKKRKKSKTKRLWTIVKIQFFLVFLVLATIGVFYGSGYAREVSDLKEEAIELVKDCEIDTFKSGETSIVYDANGNVISYLVGDKDVYYTPISDIPQYALDAIISIEDKRFYEHPGYDFRAICRAALVALREQKVTQGASTITQQLARNTFLSTEVTWQRKVEEIYVAIELEKKFSKDQILEFYLNNAYFSNGFYGIQAAAKGYFNENSNSLTLSQIAFLCAIPNGPSYYDPKLHMDRTIERRNRILENMLNDGKISEAAYNQALAETISLKENVREKNNYAETYTYYCATRLLMQMDGFEFRSIFSSENERDKYIEDYNESYTNWNRKLYTGGYRIYTTLDLDMQQKLQDQVDGVLADFTEVSEDGVYDMQGAAVCIDNSTGNVKAIVGGRYQEQIGYTLNRAYQSYRQPGSSIKPLLVYTPLFERGHTGDSLVIDQEIPDGPENADGQYWGTIDVRTAVAHSKNTVAYQLLEILTPAVGLDYLRNMNFEHLSAEDYRPVIAIGGFTYGVTPVEMAGGYATLANDGQYRPADCVSRITDSTGLILYTDVGDTRQIYSANAAREMTDVLQSVADFGTARGTTIGDFPIAVKTGTTNNYKDGWFCGYSPYYTTTVWVGYDTPKRIPDLSKNAYPRKIWQNFMTEIHEGLPRREFVGTMTIGNDDDYGHETNEDLTPMQTEGIQLIGNDQFIGTEENSSTYVNGGDEVPPEQLFFFSDGLDVQQQLQMLGLPPGTEITVLE